MTARLRLVEGGDVPIVRIAGDVDLANARALGAEIMAHTPNGALGLVLDLADTTYLDSQGVNLVLHLARRLAAHGQELRIAVPAGSHVRRILSLAHVDQHVPLDGAPREAAERVVARHRPASGDGPAGRTRREGGATRSGHSRPRARLPRARKASLGGVFDHVGIAVSDLAASERFYRTVLSVLGVEPGHADAELVEWEDWDIGATDRRHPVTRGLHVGFRAPSREAVDAFWHAGIDAGYRDDGAPGPRTVYGPDYYGGFLLDPDGNSAEAVHTQREDPVPEGCVDHLWIRVRDPAASKRFYTTIAPYAGLRVGVDEPDHVQMVGERFSFSLIHDERPLAEHVHLAFPAQDDATVRAFHAAALAAGYEDHGGPGERAAYHPGYYGAFVLDPDGHNVEVVNHNR